MAQIHRILLGFGYLALILQWLWVIAAYSPILLNIHFFDVFSTTPSSMNQSTFVSTETPFLSSLLAGFAIICALALGLYSVMKAPRYISNKMQTVTHDIAETITYKKTKHVYTPPKKRLRITKNMQLSLLYLLAIAGFIVLFPFSVLQTSVDSLIVFVIGGFLLPWTLLFFGAAYIVDRKITSS